MKTTITLILILFAVLNSTPAQSFYKNYKNLKIIGYSVQHTEDGGFIVGGSTEAEGQTKEKIFIGKFDAEGNALWHHFIDAPHFYSIHKNLTLLSDQSIILTGNDSERFIIYKFDQTGNLIWSKKHLIEGKPLFAVGSVETADGNILAAALAAQANEAIFYSIKPNGDLNWRKTLFTGSNAKTYLSFNKITDDLFIFTQSWDLLAVNSNADSLWHREYSRSIQTVIPTIDGHILAAGKIFSKIDYAGNELWQKDHNFYLADGYQNDEGEFSFISTINRNYLKFDELGNFKSSFSAGMVPYAIGKLIDGTFIISGFSNTSNIYLSLYKPNTYGTLIKLLKPNGGESISNSEPYYIKWQTINVDSINIEISIDNGATWQNIAENVPHQGYYNYSIVFSFPPSDQCLLKISDSSNPLANDQSDSVFSLIRYHSYDYTAANQIKMWLGNNGMSAHNPISGYAGFYWPGGENASIPAIFIEGILIGGKINGQPRVHGATYRYGLTPGVINPDGTAANPFDIKYQMYKIKKGWESMPAGELRDKYEFNHNNWPVDAGAPYFDFNEDGEFTPGIDGPAYYGDETLYYVANDMDSNTTEFLYGSPPVGLEFQTTLFARPDEGLEDAVFKKVKVINKSGETFEDVYLSYWTDDDLGDANDDYVGCDTTLNLGFTYNGDNDDQNYYGVNPPAVGHLMIQGPKVPGEPDDSARFGNGWIKGYKNLPLTGFQLYISASTVYTDPDMGIYNGTNQVYYQMQGKIWNGDPIIDPTTGSSTPFCLYGDPVEGTGWYEGPGWSGSPARGDRRYLMSSGPFTMAPGDTQEVVYAIYMARGSDRLNSVTKLKEKAIELVDFYNGDFITSVDEKTNYTPSEFVLYQNYPNPFNPTTKIGLVIPSGVEGLSTLKVYDVLGQEITTLLNKPLQPGTYEVEFDGSNLPSGVYMYQLKSASFIETKKMLLLK